MFRFTIRELVLLTLVVAMGVAWWLDRERQATVAYRAALWQLRAEAIARSFDELEFRVSYDRDGTRVRGTGPNGVYIDYWTRTTPLWPIPE
jgi:hypothetical protein